jgi:hypothetical protein
MPWPEAAPFVAATGAVVVPLAEPLADPLADPLPPELPLEPLEPLPVSLLVPPPESVSPGATVPAEVYGGTQTPCGGEASTAVQSGA